MRGPVKPPQLFWNDWREAAGKEGHARSKVLNVLESNIRRGLYTGGYPTGETRVRSRRKYWLWGPTVTWNEAEYEYFKGVHHSKGSFGDNYFVERSFVWAPLPSVTTHE